MRLTTRMFFLLKVFTNLKKKDLFGIQEIVARILKKKWPKFYNTKYSKMKSNRPQFHKRCINKEYNYWYFTTNIIDIKYPWRKNYFTDQKEVITLPQSLRGIFPIDTPFTLPSRNGFLILYRPFLKNIFLSELAIWIKTLRRS